MSLLRTSPRGGGAGIRAGKLGRVRAVHNHRSHFGPVLTGSVHTRVAAYARFSSLCVAAGWRAIAARAPPHPLRTRNRSNPLRCFLPRCPRALLHLREHTCPCPYSSPFVHLTIVDSFSFLSAPRASPPRDCPTLRPRAGLPLSRACNSPFAMSFGATRRRRTPFPSSSRQHAVGCCLSASRPLTCPSSLQPCVAPYLHVAEYTCRQRLSSLLFVG